MTERKIIDTFSRIVDKFGLDVAGLRILYFSNTFLGLVSLIFVYLILYLIKPSLY